MGTLDMFSPDLESSFGPAGSPSADALAPPPWRASVTGLLFEMDGVLYDNSAWRLWLFRTVGRLGLHTNYHAFFATWERDYQRPACLGETTLEEALGNFLRSAGLSHGQADEVVTATRSQIALHENSLRPLPGVAATLKRLSGAGLKMGVVCNATAESDAVWTRLDRAGIAGCFATVATSRDLGHALPDIHGYRLAASRLAASGLLAFVGGNAPAVTAARRAGMASIGVGMPERSPADAHVCDIRELTGIFA